jgi:hypothetical protein
MSFPAFRRTYWTKPDKTGQNSPSSSDVTGPPRHLVISTGWQDAGLYPPGGVDLHTVETEILVRYDEPRQISPF